MYLSFSVLTENLDSSLLRLKYKQNQPRHSVGWGGGPVNTVISGFDEEVADGGGEGSLRVTSVTRVCGAETPRNLDTSIVQPVVFISYLTFVSWVHVTHVGLAGVDASCCSCEIMHDLLKAMSVKHIG